MQKCTLGWTAELHSWISFHFQGEEADDDDIYNVLSTLKRLTSFHKYVFCSLENLQLSFQQVSAGVWC